MARKIETEKFVRKLFHVEAVEVTAENMEAVAAWCQGEVRTEEHTNDAKGRTVIDKYVKVRVHRPLNDRQTKAFVSDMVLYAGSGFKVYTRKAFDSNFEKDTSATPTKDSLPEVFLLKPQSTEELFVTAEKA